MNAFVTEQQYVTVEALGGTKSCFGFLCFGRNSNPVIVPYDALELRQSRSRPYHNTAKETDVRQTTKLPYHTMFPGGGTHRDQPTMRHFRRRPSGQITPYRLGCSRTTSLTIPPREFSTDLDWGRCLVFFGCLEACGDTVVKAALQLHSLILHERQTRNASHMNILP